MMEFISLLKTQARVYYGLSAMKYRYLVKKKDLWEPIMAAFGILAGGGTLLVMYVFYLKGIFLAGIMIHQPHFMPGLVIMAAQLLILFLGLLWTVSVFYFSDDAEILMPLPVEPYKILMSKFCLILLNEYITLGFLMIPAIIVYGAGTGASALYYVVSAVVFVFTPVIPLSVASIISVYIMRFVNRRKKKDLFTVVIMSLAMIFAIGMQFFAQGMQQGGGGRFIGNAFAQNAGLVNAAFQKFPPALWGALSLTRYNELSGLFNLCLFTGVSLLLSGILLLSAQKIYYAGLAAGQEFESARRKIDIEKHIIRSGILKTLMQREFKLFFRTPVYAMNVLPVAVIIPVALFMPLSTTMLKSGADQSMITGFTSNIGNWFYIFAAGLGFSLFVAGTNSLSSTAFSREGRLLDISRMIPVEAGAHVNAKWLFGVMITLLLLLPSYTAAWIIFKIPWAAMLIMVVVSIIGIALINIIGLLIDALRPTLDWENPQKAMKGNLNVLISMLITVILMIILGAIILLLKYVRMGDIIIAVIIVACLMAFTKVAYEMALRAAKKLLSR